MAKSQLKALKTSLYRLNHPAGKPLVELVREKYVRRGFSIKEVELGGKSALVVHGAIVKDRPDWFSHMESLTGERPEVFNSTSGGILAIRLDDHSSHCYALSWSLGHLLLEPAMIDPGFGLRFVLRRADPKQVSALTVHTLDTLPKTARTSVFGGAGIESFGMEEIGEVISRLVVKVSVSGLSAEKKKGKAGRVTGGTAEAYVTVRGADSLAIPLGLDWDDLLSDLALIDRIVESEEPISGLEYLENTRPLNVVDPRIQKLNEVLSRALVAGEERLAICWPAALDDEVGEVAKFEVKSGSRVSGRVYEDIHIDHLLDALKGVPDAEKLARLKKVFVQGKDVSGSAKTQDISGEKWITFETVYDEQQYVFHRGRWFNVGGAYLEQLQDRVARILSSKSSEYLPPWPRQSKVNPHSGAEVVRVADEAVYNKLVAERCPGYLSLDRKKVYTDQHPRGFESCDILTPNGALVHVKRIDDSVSASHLFNQAIVSAEALRRPDARRKFRDLVTSASGGGRRISEDFQVEEVVLAFAGKVLTAKQFYTFSQVGLSRCALRLNDLGIRLTVALIPYSEEVVDGL